MKSTPFTPESGRTKNLAVQVIDWETVPVSLTRAEAAKIVRIGLTALRDAIELGQLREVRYGRQTCRVSRYDLQSFHEGRERQPVIVPLPTQVEGSSTYTIRDGQVIHNLVSPHRGTASFKAQLAVAVQQAIDAKKLTVAAAAEALGLDQSRLTALTNGHLSEFTVERLLECLLALGLEVTLQVRPSTADAPSVRVQVG